MTKTLIKKENLIKKIPNGIKYETGDFKIDGIRFNFRAECGKSFSNYDADFWSRFAYFSNTFGKKSGNWFYLATRG